MSSLVGVVVLICTYFGHRVQESIVVCSRLYICKGLFRLFSFGGCYVQFGNCVCVDWSK